MEDRTSAWSIYLAPTVTADRSSSFSFGFTTANVQTLSHSEFCLKLILPAVEFSWILSHIISSNTYNRNTNGNLLFSVIFVIRFVSFCLLKTHSNSQIHIFNSEKDPVSPVQIKAAYNLTSGMIFSQTKTYSMWTQLSLLKGLFEMLYFSEWSNSQKFIDS